MTTRKKLTKKVTKKVMKKAAEPNSAKKVVPASFNLNRLLDTKPCDDGLAEALFILRDKRCIEAPDELWPVLEMLENPPSDFAKKYLRGELKKMADRVIINVKPNVIARLFVDNEDFLNYAEKMMTKRGRAAANAAAYGLVKQDLVLGDRKAVIERLETRLNHLKRDIENRRSALQQTEKELLTVEKSLAASVAKFAEKDNVLPLDRFDVFQFIRGDMDECDVCDVDVTGAAAEVVRALAL